MPFHEHLTYISFTVEFEFRVDCGLDRQASLGFGQPVNASALPVGAIRRSGTRSSVTAPRKRSGVCGCSACLDPKILGLDGSLDISMVRVQ
jgi:hypothetical protein